MTFRHQGVMPARFLVFDPVNGIVIGLDGVEIPSFISQPGVLVIHRWVPNQVRAFRWCLGVVVLARSVTCHPAVIALHLGLPSCVVDPEDWPDDEPDWIWLDPDRKEVRWGRGAI